LLFIVDDTHPQHSAIPPSAAIILLSPSENYPYNVILTSPFSGHRPYHQNFCISLSPHHYTESIFGECQAQAEDHYQAFHAWLRQFIHGEERLEIFYFELLQHRADGSID
jgi:hypothetical protein